MNRLGGAAGVGVLGLVLLIAVICFLVRYQDPAAPCAEDDTECFLAASLTRGIVLGLAAVPTTLPQMLILILLTARAEIQAPRRARQPGTGPRRGAASCGASPPSRRSGAAP